VKRSASDVLSLHRTLRFIQIACISRWREPSLLLVFIALLTGRSAPVGVRQLTNSANVGYSDGRKTITFQQRSDGRVLIYICNRLITLFTKDSV